MCVRQEDQVAKGGLRKPENANEDILREMYREWEGE